MSRYKLRKSKAKQLFKKPRGLFEPIDLNENPGPSWMTRAFMNNRYVVMINDKAHLSDGVIAIKAMVQRHDNQPIPNHWREMQLIKNEMFGDETTAIEYYPPQSQLVDDFNIYWLWVLPEGVLPRCVQRPPFNSQ